MKKTGGFFLSRDNYPLGIALAILLPIIVILAIYKIKFSDIPLKELTSQSTMITFFGVWCLVANIALFTYFINTQKDRTAKAIFAVTLVLGLAILAVKLFR